MPLSVNSRHARRPP